MARRRKYTRLYGYDYANSGTYFVTICTHERRSILGTITDNAVVEMTSLGRIVERELLRTTQVRPSVQVDSYVIMPNHLHALLVLGDTNGGTTRATWTCCALSRAPSPEC